MGVSNAPSPAVALRCVARVALAETGLYIEASACVLSSRYAMLCYALLI